MNLKRNRNSQKNMETGQNLQILKYLMLLKKQLQNYQVQEYIKSKKKIIKIKIYPVLNLPLKELMTIRKEN